MADDISAGVWEELTELAKELTAPGESECVRCYLLRMVNEFGCDGTHRWAVLWRDLRAAQPRGLLRQFELRGGFCDCEILFNVFPEYPDSAVRLPCAGVPRPGSAKPCALGALRPIA